MDREQEEMQFLGFFDIYKESYKIIFTWRKIFTQITLALILPLSFIFLAHIQITDLIFSNIIHDEIQLDHTKAGSPRSKKLNDLISSEWTYFWLFKIAYFTFFLIFSSLSTAAVVYTIACIYTGRDITFTKVMSVVPKLASVVSVLEEACGFKAMEKSRALIKGKLLVTAIIFFLLNLSLFLIQVAFKILVVHGRSLGMVSRVSYGIICFLLLFILFLFGLVIQTVIYFVCKSYHHENIDKSALSDHLEVYLGEYVPLKAKDVQLEQFQV
ncbi:hypothetical protein GH714_021874 [Hevea brasiliensis]|uniref:Uncharacterized protein n=1 Tax=Hevea brasiliensis TaxID=3981 RepID=A0A6A6M2J6_HEVBR|nr:hypothetical protein GH714_021874 [Hevea brasiliensis]